jgi:Peptidase M50B-like
LTWNPEDKERTALHEAGHAVVAWSFGVTVGYIHLDLENESGHAQIASTAHLEPFEQIANWLAGYEAEQVFKPPGNGRRAFDDFYDKVPKILRENGTSLDEPEGQDLRERGRACAESRLRKHENKVRAVACHLVEHHRMDRALFEAMMHEN